MLDDPKTASRNATLANNEKVPAIQVYEGLYVPSLLIMKARHTFLGLPVSAFSSSKSVIKT